MNFESEINNDIVVERINIYRATYREAEDFRKFVEADVSTCGNKYLLLTWSHANI
jgi:hypothetical protein